MPTDLDETRPGDFGSATSPALTEGQRLGDYRLVEFLGRGGFAEVWDAEREEDGRRVAVKVLLHRHGASEQALRRFEREGRLAASLSHSRAVYVIAAGQADGYPIIAMERMAGGTLQDRLDRDGRLPVRTAVDAILDVAEGLEAAQRLGIVHRDVKPSNCFVDEEGRTKIGDFGISRSLGIEGGLTTTGTFLGTPFYASPEQLRGEKLDLRSDLYSLGATLYALLTGGPPFQSSNPADLVSRILTEPPQPPDDKAVRLPRDLWQVLQRLLAKDPARRFDSHASLRAALRPFSSRGIRPASPPRRIAAAMLDWFLVTLGVLAVALLAGLQPESMRSFVSYPFLVAYFTLLEGSRGWSVGKLATGIRVRGPDMAPPGALAAMQRSAVLFLGPCIVDVAYWFFGPGDVRYIFSWLASYFVVFLPARAANGWTGFHDRVTGTRVVQRRQAETARERAEIPPLPVTDVAPDRGEGDEIGGYRVIGLLWRSEAEALYLGHDDALDRAVWIHTGRACSRSAEADPNRLQWLRGGEQREVRWDAFEAPDGSGLVEMVDAREGVDWRELRAILRDFARAAHRGVARGDLPAELSLRNLWIDPFGNVKILDFPYGRDSMSDRVAPGDWEGLLPPIARYGLERTRGGGRPRVPLPEPARRFFEDLVRDGRSRDPARSVASLERLAEAELPEVRSLRQRHLVYPGIVPILVGAFFYLAAVVESGGSRSGLGSALLALPWLVAPLVLFSLPALLSAFAFRGGLLLSAFGLAVQTGDGRPAGRWRCGLRALIAWLPLMLLGSVELAHTVDLLTGEASQSLTDIWFTNEVNVGGVSMRLPFALHPYVAALLTIGFFAGSLLSAARPASGVQDRLCGTTLVQR